ncbi:50S ribosome-binding GTPase, partial [Candidatus Gracilibacteria bacterium]|nr:50S ribosome-binding GTPase [Candidatus Gracilibacteria bacterium]
ITNLKSEIIKKLKELGFDYKEKKYDESWIKIAIIGKPNVGKSSIVNAITGENRVMVKDIAGTTRDAVDSLFEWNNQKFVIIDTAGIRRSGKIGSKNIEKWSLLRSERAIERADIIAVVIDGFDGITAGDQHIIQKALEANKGIILVINKWDKVLNIPGTDKEKAIDKYIYHLRNKLEFLPYVTPIFTIAIEGKRLNDILETAIKIKEERKKRIQTSVFNDFLSQIVFKHAPTGTRKSHKPKIFYGSQVDINPPKFLISVNNSDHFHFSYKRYIENKIREFFGFWGTPIIIELKGRESIYKKKLVKFKNVDHRFKKDNSSK